MLEAAKETAQHMADREQTPVAVLSLDGTYGALALPDTLPTDPVLFWVCPRPRGAR